MYRIHFDPKIGKFIIQVCIWIVLVISKNIGRIK